MLRTILEQSSHRLVIRRRLPAPFTAARIYASTEGGLRYLRPRADRIDPALLSLAAELIRPGATVWDIGANVGLFTFAAAAAAGPSGRVIAVEPDTGLAGLLRRSAAANPGLAPVDVLCAAVASQPGLARYCVARRNRATSHLEGYGTSQAGGIRAVHTVPAVTLDAMAGCFPPPGVLKIDVEEAELAVLRGGAAVLSAGPAVVCEVAGANAAAVHGVLAGHGYELFDGDQPAGMRAPLAAAPPSTLAIRRPA